MAKIGIDLGTYNSAVAGERPDGEIEMLTPAGGLDSQGTYVFPSFVKFDLNGELISVGLEAKRDLPNNPLQVVWGVKRLIGRAYKEITEETKRFLYPIKEAKDGRVLISIGEKTYTPVEVSAFILKKIREDAEGDWNPIGKGEVDAATVSVPANYSDEQIRATRDAAITAGLPNVSIIREPIAAAIAYGIKRIKKQKLAFVFDLGAGTLDIVSVVLITGKDGKIALADAYPPSGNPQLGGLDMDDLILESVIKNEDLDLFQKVQHTPIPQDKDAIKTLRELFNLRQELETAKMRLSTKTSVNVGFIYQGAPRIITLTRTAIEQMVEPVTEECRQCLRSYLNEIGINSADIDYLLLVGGPVKMPAIQDMLRQEFKGNQEVLSQLDRIKNQGFPIDPMESVAYGAAKYGAAKSEQISLITTSPFSYGLAVGPVNLGQRPHLPDMIQKGQVLKGKEAASNQGISVRTKRSVASLSISLTRDHSTVIGNYDFSAAVSIGGRSNVLFKMQASEEGIIDLNIKDEWTGNRIHFPQLSELTGTEIDYELVDVKKDVDPDPGPPDRYEDRIVSKEEVEQVIIIAQALIGEAEELAAGNRNLTQEKIEELQSLIQKLPNQEVRFSQLQKIIHKTTELQHQIELIR